MSVDRGKTDPHAMPRRPVRPAHWTKASGWALTADNSRLVRRIVATNVRRERERAGMSHRTLAERAGTGISTVARIESLKAEASISTLVALAIGLRAPLPSLLVDLPRPVVGESAWLDDPTAASSWTLTPDNRRLIRVVLGENLRRERNRIGISQQLLARSTHVAEDTIRRTERARQEPRVLTLVALSFGLPAPLLSLLVNLPSASRRSMQTESACH